MLFSSLQSPVRRPRFSSPAPHFAPLLLLLLHQRDKPVYSSNLPQILTSSETCFLSTAFLVSFTESYPVIQTHFPLFPLGHQYTSHDIDIDIELSACLPTSITTEHLHFQPNTTLDLARMRHPASDTQTTFRGSSRTRPPLFCPSKSRPEHLRDPSIRLPSPRRISTVRP